LSNWGTMWREVLLNAGRPESEGDKAKRAIVGAIQQHRDAGFFFNEGSLDVATVDAQSGYGEADSGFPKGLVEIIGELHLEIEQDAENRIELVRKSWPAMREYRLYNPESGQPLVWSFWNGKVELAPTPDATVHNVVGECIVDVGTLTHAYAGAAWHYYKPNTTTDLADDYPTGADVNRWFKEGYQMILAYAEYLVYGGKVHAKDGRSEAALTRYLECRASLETRGSRLSTPKAIEPMELF
jgi:hypothetical protein